MRSLGLGSARSGRADSIRRDYTSGVGMLLKKFRMPKISPDSARRAKRSRAPALNGSVASYFRYVRARRSRLLPLLPSSPRLQLPLASTLPRTRYLVAISVSICLDCAPGFSPARRLPSLPPTQLATPRPAISPGTKFDAWPDRSVLGRFSAATVSLKQLFHLASAAVMHVRRA